MHLDCLQTYPARLSRTKKAALIQLWLRLTLGLCAFFLCNSNAVAQDEVKRNETPQEYETLLNEARGGDNKSKVDYFRYVYDLADPDSNEIAEAIELLKQAAEDGFLQAQYSYGLLFRDGKWVERNENVFVPWLTLAANQGAVEAQAVLGLYHYKKARASTVDEHIRFNHNQAIRWYSAAKDSGYEKADYFLGAILIMYDSRREEGKELLRVAKSRGSVSAAEALEIIADIEKGD